MHLPEKKNNGHGGRREGAGRHKLYNETKVFSFTASGEMIPLLEGVKHRSQFIKDCINCRMSTASRKPDFSQIGEAYPANEIRDLRLPMFDVSIVAGFPIPLDNDERAQSIELISMLCPYPESCYLIRVKGNSMIDADIHDGDIVIVDKSKRNPSEEDVAVCELNGEYTLKHFIKEGNEGWLVPENADFPRIKITDADDFSIWGVVTYVIHKASPHSKV